MSPFNASLPSAQHILHELLPRLLPLDEQYQSYQEVVFTVWFGYVEGINCENFRRIVTKRLGLFPNLREDNKWTSYPNNPPVNARSKKIRKEPSLAIRHRCFIDSSQNFTPIKTMQPTSAK
uniref:Uncharacterized protein n=1 Tax=Glossina austeni TaxID=7395 RepID=A0A1A9UZH7_GLOAU